MFRYLLMFLVIFSGYSVIAAPGAKSYKAGKELYDNQNYREALLKFNQAFTENPADYTAKGCYMIALTLNKLDRCSMAASYFKKAITADPEKGGASSKAKFEEKVEECGLDMAAVNNAADQLPSLTDLNAEPVTQTAPVQTQDVENTPAPVVTSSDKEEGGSSFGWIVGLLIVGALGFGAYKYMNRNKADAGAEAQSAISENLVSIQDVLFNDAYWLDFEAKYNKETVERIRLSWQMEYSAAVDTRDQVAANELLRKLRKLDASPGSIFVNNEHSA